MKTVDFVDAIRAQNGNCSFYALKKILGVSQPTVSDWRHGKQFFRDDMALRVAALLHLDPAYVLACVHAERAERAKRPEEKEIYDRIAETFRRSAAALFLSAGLYSGAALDNPAQGSFQLNGNIHYTKRRRFPPQLHRRLGDQSTP